MTDAGRSASAVCLCGGVTLRVGDLAQVFGACHCEACQRWGGIWTAVQCRRVDIEGGEGIRRYRSSAWAERGFCSDCGSHLFWRRASSDSYYVPVGLFPKAVAFEFSRQIFIDRKPAYYCFANDTEVFTEHEVAHRFGPEATA